MSGTISHSPWRAPDRTIPRHHIIAARDRSHTHRLRGHILLIHRHAGVTTQFLRRRDLRIIQGHADEQRILAGQPVLLQPRRKIQPFPIRPIIRPHMPHIRDPPRFQRRHFDVHLLRCIQGPLRLQRHINMNIHPLFPGRVCVPGTIGHHKSRRRPQFPGTPREPFAIQILEGVLDFGKESLIFPTGQFFATATA